MKHSRVMPEQSDPDPLVIDLMVGLAGTAIAGAIKKAGVAILAAARRRRQTPADPSVAVTQLQQLRRELDELERRSATAASLVGSGRRELGGMVMLDPNRLQEYHELRESIFGQLRRVDEMAESFGDPDEHRARAGKGRRTGLPKEFRERLKYVDQRLRDARCATLAGEAFLDVTAAVGMLRQILEFLDQQF